MLVPPLCHPTPAGAQHRIDFHPNTAHGANALCTVLLVRTNVRVSFKKVRLGTKLENRRFGAKTTKMSRASPLMTRDATECTWYHNIT